jgi:hypothetical protein
MKFISFEKVFPRLYQKLPGFIKGTPYCITANSGVGKSKLAKFLTVIHSYKYCKENNIPLKVIYFALEESSEKFWITIICDMLYEKYRLTCTYYQYIGAHSGCDESMKKKMDEFTPVIEEMKKDILVFDYIFNPTGIFLKTTEILHKIGTKSEGVEFKDDAGNTYKDYKYEYNNPNQHVIMVVDHVSLLSVEKNYLHDCSTLHGSMSTLSSHYVLKHLIKKYQCVTILVQQQAMSGEGADALKLDNLQPSISKLGNNLEIARDYAVVIGLFNPARYSLTKKSYGGYDIEKMSKTFRELSIAKHRDGEDQIRIPMFFNGKINYFEELPYTKDINYDNYNI